MDIKQFNLNKNQLEAITTKSSVVRVIAGAGSGKTRVLVLRIMYLLETVNPENIVAITFTNKAANEMKERISLWSDQDIKLLTVSTIHSLCLKILRMHGHYVGLRPNFNICDTDDQKKIIKDIIKKNKLDALDKPAGLVSLLSNYKFNGYDILSYIDIDESEFNAQFARLFQLYHQKLEQNNALDFDDLILKAVICLKENQFVKEYWSNQFKWILVDEFQDVDKNQMELIRLLASKYQQLYVVGDPDQTIYTWRGADVSIINNLTKIYPQTQTIVLNENYRSSQNILNCANLLISNNQQRVAKELYSNNVSDIPVEWHSFYSSHEQADYISNEIKKMHSQGTNYDEIAILYRSNYLSRSLENQLMSYHIPYRIVGGINFYARSEIKDVLSYLKLALLEDDLSFIRIANVPKRKIGDKTLEKVDDIASEKGINYYQAAKEVSQFKGFIDVINSIKKDLDLDFEDLINNIMLKTGLREYYINLKEEERIDNIKELINDGKEYFFQNPESNLAEYLDHVSLYSERKMAQDDCVSLMSIHAAKGLEFRIVFIASFNDGILPNSRTMLESGFEGLEEERRLAYVAMTRAKERLVCIDNRDRSFDFSSRLTISRFFNECKEAVVYSDHTGSLIGHSDHSPLVENNYQALPLTIGQIVNHIDYGKGRVMAINDDIVEIDFVLGFRKSIVNRDDLLSIVQNTDNSYSKGSLYEHPKYGKGVVLAVLPKFYKVSFIDHGIKQIKR